MASRDEARRYYEDFSLAAGMRDWLRPNRRHEALKLLVDRVLDGRHGLRLLDVGCGAGVLTHHLTRFGSVTGIDFSSGAIAAAREIAPGAEFVVGSLEDVAGDRVFDVITLFDVLEHIPGAERPGVLEGIRRRLADDGLVFVSTPHPRFTAHRRALGDPTLQIIDELVDVSTVTTEAAAAGLQLVWYEAFDVFKGSPEYQAMVFAPTGTPGGNPLRQPRGLRVRMKIVGRPLAVRARRARHALRLARHGRFRSAAWFLRASVPHVES